MLPESNFRFRRIFSYVLTTLVLAILAYVVYQLDDAKELGRVAFWLIILLWWVATYYMIAPSAEQIARIIQSARISIFNRKDDGEE